MPLHTLRDKMAFSERANSFLVGVAVLCAIITTSLMIRREFFRPSPPQRVTEVLEVTSPEQYARGGHRIGPDDATITIVEFADFECPFCRQAALGPLLMLRQRFGVQMAIVFRQSPGPGHRFAIPAARAANCAGEQGRFVEYHDVLFEKQDSLGLKSFRDFATSAGVPDLQQFDRCNGNQGEVPGVSADMAAAKAIGVRGTPALLVGRQLLIGVPDSVTLERIVARAIAEGELRTK